MSVQGPAGPAGPAGTPGALTDRAQLYTVKSSVVGVNYNGNPLEPTPATASCLAETDILLMGWCVPTLLQGSGQYWYGVGLNTAGNPMAWECNGVNNDNPSTFNLQAFATCIAVP
jgi:hypothetical protein